MGRPLENNQPGIESGALGAYAITPNDDTDLTDDIRAITIGGTAGTVSYIGWNGVTYTTGTLPQGSYPMLARRIRATGTTATSITGWV
jgi:hypothetical protein